jgi:acetylornithine deacetylase/succinyl-diaminopimelate desuccinylase-like protein
MEETLLTREALQVFADSRRIAFEAELRTLVEIPSVSSDPGRLPDIRRCAEAAVDLFRRYGGQAELLETSGNPLVLGRFDLDPGYPTVTVYNHLDVQPANEPEWASDPFRLEVQGDTYLGRGTTDDKGPALTAFFGALAALGAGVPLNLHFLWELEEEIGSPSFREGLEAHRDKLGGGLVIVSDTIWVTRGRPSTPAGLRGLAGFRLTLETARHDLHSGVVGGAARNPLAELITAVADMLDGPTGRVKIPHFYREVEKPSRKELREWAQSGFSVATFKADHHLLSLRTDRPRRIMKRIWARPTMEVHGVVGGYTGPGIKTAVPPRAEVKLSCRLVPGMDVATTLDRIRQFLATHHPDVQMHAEQGLAPFRGQVAGPYAQAVKAAYAFGFGTPCCFTREGGSIGAVSTLEEVLGCQVFFLGLSLPSHGYHAPNENYDWEQSSGGMAAFAHFFQEVSGFARG